MRVIKVAAIQMGPIQKADSREAVVKRMIVLLDEAKARSADLIVYPELTVVFFGPSDTRKRRPPFCFQIFPAAW